MKKIFLSWVIFIVIFTSFSCVMAEPLYTFNYKIENVTYKGGNNVEAEISFYVDECIEDVNAEFLMIVAVYDNKDGRFTGCASKDYYKRNMFSDETEKTTTVPITISDLNIQEYLFKIILIENFDTLKSVAYVKENDNCLIVENNFDEIELSLDYSVYPMIVKSVSNGIVTGFVNGAEFTYQVAQNPKKIGITGIENEDVYEIGTNDVIWYVLNSKNEITSYRHLINYDNGYYYGMLSTTGDERNNIETDALLYNLSTLKLADIQPRTPQLCGYAVAGLPHSVLGNIVELFKKVDGFSSESELKSQSNINEVGWDWSVCTYSLSETAENIRLTNFETVKTYDRCSSISALDKVVYVYWYDDYNTCNLTINYSAE